MKTTIKKIHSELRTLISSIAEEECRLFLVNVCDWHHDEADQVDPQESVFVELEIAADSDREDIAESMLKTLTLINQDTDPMQELIDNVTGATSIHTLCSALNTLNDERGETKLDDLVDMSGLPVWDEEEWGSCTSNLWSFQKVDGEWLGLVDDLWSGRGFSVVALDISAD